MLFICSELGNGATSEAGKSSELQMCGGGYILLLSLVPRCQETIYVCIWHMFVFMSVVVGMFVVFYV